MRQARLAAAARQVLALTTGPVACEVPSAEYALRYRALPELRAALDEFLIEFERQAPYDSGVSERTGLSSVQFRHTERTGQAANPEGEGSNGDSP